MLDAAYLLMAVGEANYGRLGTTQALFYMRSIADELDLEMPGALPEISPSPQYDPFVDFRDRAMFMQAWSSYGIQWPVIHHFLGIRPDAPTGSLTVVPDVPESWTEPISAPSRGHDPVRRRGLDRLNHENSGS